MLEAVQTVSLVAQLRSTIFQAIRDVTSCRHKKFRPVCWVAIVLHAGEHTESLK